MSTQRRTFLKTWWSPYLGEWRPFHDNFIYASNTGCTFSGSAVYSPVPPTPSMTASPTQTMTPSVTPTLTPTNTQTSTPTNTPSNTPTRTPQVTPTNTNTSTVTPTMTNTPSSTISNCNYLYFSSATFTTGISGCPNSGDSYSLSSSEFQGNYYLSDDGVSQAKYMSYINGSGTTTCGSLTGTNYSMWIKYPTNSSGITIAIAAVTNLLIRANDFHFIFYSGGTYVGNCGTTNTCMAGALFINTGDTVNGLLYPATSGFLSPGGNAVPFTIDYFCPSPTPTNTTTNTSTPTLTPTITQTRTPQPTSTPTLSVSPTQTNTPSSTVTLTPTITQTRTPRPTPSSTPFDPSSLGDLQYWFKSTDGVSASTWTNLGLIGGALTQPVAANQPQIIANDTFKFAYTGQSVNFTSRDFMTMNHSASPVTFTAKTFFFVSQVDNRSNTGWSINIQDGAVYTSSNNIWDYQFYGGALTTISRSMPGRRDFTFTTGATLYGASGLTTTGFTASVNDVIGTSGTTTYVGQNANYINFGYDIGSSTVNDISMFEFLGYNKLLTPSEYAQVMSYLKMKYSYDIEYYYYDVEAYDKSTCTLVTTGIVKARSAFVIPLNYFMCNSSSPYKYKLISYTTGPTATWTLDTFVAGLNCSTLPC